MYDTKNYKEARRQLREIAIENGQKMPEFLFDKESKDLYPEDEEVSFKSTNNTLETPDSPNELELTSITNKKGDFDSIEETADSEEINLIGGCNYQGQQIAKLPQKRPFVSTKKELTPI